MSDPPLTPRAPRVLRVEQVMGTAFGVDVRDSDVAGESVESAIDMVFESLREVDARFSTYRGDSEISRLSRGQVLPRDCHADVREVLWLCDEVERASGGVFSARRDGALDPSALVKGWSAERAALILQLAGMRSFSINAGGDVLLRGEAAPGEAWRVGIRHPDDPKRMAAVLALRSGGVATSGLYERGPHIAPARAGSAMPELLSMTVVGASLTYADAYSTAAFAMGTRGVRWVAEVLPGYEAYAVTAERRAVWTPGMDALLQAAPLPRRTQRFPES
jgi:thiamine biosynthesis lipoprotein